MSIEDQVRAAEQAFNQTFAEMGEEDFAREAERIAYLKEFLRTFPILASTAWSDFLELRPEVDSVVMTALEAGSDESMNEAFVVVSGLTSAWCRDHRIESESGWMEKMAAITLFGMLLHEILGLECPDGFAMFRPIFFERTEGMIESTSANIIFYPFAVVEVDANLGPQVWDQVRETRAQFRARVCQEFTEKLDHQLDKVGTPSLSPDLVEINFQWVEWFILVQVEGQSIKRASEQLNVSRTAIRKGVRKVGGYLRIKSYGT